MSFSTLKRNKSLRQSYAEKIRREGYPPAKPRKPPKSRKPMKRVSSARAIAARVYGARRKKFMAEHPFCQAYTIIWPGEPVPSSEDIHHVAGRSGSNYLDVKTWLAVSRKAHDFIHAHPNKSRALGLLK